MWMVVAGGSETESLPDAGQRPRPAARTASQESQLLPARIPCKVTREQTTFAASDGVMRRAWRYTVHRIPKTSRWPSPGACLSSPRICQTAAVSNGREWSRLPSACCRRTGHPIHLSGSLQGFALGSPPSRGLWPGKCT